MSELLRFGAFEADLRTGELRKHGLRIKLAAQAFKLLAALLERPGELVTREELRQILWPNETVVDFDHSINTAIKRIREALNDSIEERRYLETLPRRGYRFVAEVERISGEMPLSPQSAALSPRASRSPGATPADFDWSNPIGQVISRYRVLDVLGRGGMGIVYRAEDLRLGRRVALKFLAVEPESDPAALKRFEFEAQTASALNHPNICTIYDVEVHSDGAFIAMELLEGETLGERIRNSTEGSSLSTQNVLDIAIQIGSALEAAHASAVIHRDIKPTNIFLGRREEVKVLDFGLAKRSSRATTGTTSDGLTRLGTIPGTTLYMSPEQAAGQDLDGRSDLYSLGLILYQAATGSYPSIATGANWPPVAASSGFPPRFWQVLSRLLQPDRELRYQTATELIIDLRSIKEQISSGAVPVSIPKVEEPALERKRRGWTVAVVGTAAVLITCTAAVLWLRGLTPSHGSFEIRPFDGLGGLEDDLAFAPNAKQAAFVWNGGSGSDYHVYVKLIGVGPPLGLTSGPGWDRSPAWSPDGRYLAFVHSDGSNQSVWIVPALGGTARRVSALRGGLWDQSSRVVTWSTDGESLLVSDSLREGEPPGIALLPVNGGQEKAITHPHPGDFGDSDPAVSPDGSALAYIHWMRNSVSEVMTQALSGGEPKQLTHDGKRVNGLAWSQDGQKIVFSSTRGALPGLWQIAVSGGSPGPLAGAGEDAMSPAIARQGNLLAYTRHSENVNLWEIPGPRGGPAGAKPVKLISSPRQQISGTYSPDGKQIAFASDRSGSFEIWVASRDGNNARQLTSFAGPITGSPRWSHDGQWIAFDSRPAGHSAIFVISAAGGAPRQVTSSNFDNLVPSWSHDDSHIYFCSTRSGTQEIWQIAAGGGVPKQITHGGGFESIESEDGEWLYYSNRGAIWRMPETGGSPSLILNRLTARYWTLGAGRITFLQMDSTPYPTVHSLDLRSGQISQLGQLENPAEWGYSGLSVSPDGRWLIYAQMDELVSRIMQVSGFR